MINYINKFPNYRRYLPKTLVDPITGQIFTIPEVIEAHEITRSEKKERQFNGLRYKKEKTITSAEASALLGNNFYYLHYENLLDLFANYHNKSKYTFAFRFIYLCSYVNYDNILVTDPMKRSKTKYINESDLKDILKLSSKQINEFKNICFNMGILKIISIDGIDMIKVSKKIICKGKLPSFYKKNCTRISVPHIKTIYASSPPREHKTLGYLLALLPNIHYKYGILTSNPDMEYKLYLKPLSIQNICEILDYDKTNASKLLKTLRKFTINGTKIFLTSSNDGTPAYFLNPCLFLKASSLEGLTLSKALLDAVEPSKQFT